MRDRDRRRRGDGGDARHAGCHGERHAGIGQGERLLAAATEDEGVAALEPHDVEPGSAVRDEQVVDRLLPERRPRDDQRVVRRLGDEVRRHERVVDEHVAPAHELQAAGGDQPRVARPRADEMDRHESASSTSFSK